MAANKAKPSDKEAFFRENSLKKKQVEINGMAITITEPRAEKYLAIFHDESISQSLKAAKAIAICCDCFDESDEQRIHEELSNEVLTELFLEIVELVTAKKKQKGC